MKLLAWGRLARVSLAPSAAADAVAGVTIGAWGLLPMSASVPLLVSGSLCVYHGGMVLNDWADRDDDARTRPDRPIPSRAVSASSALRAAAVLLACGPLLAWFAAPTAGVCLAAAALAAALYDLAGRGPWRGPLLLALCRGLNLGAGVVLGGALVAQRLPGAPRWGLAACLAYAAYVFFTSRLGRLEDDADARPLGRRPSRSLFAAAICLAIVPLLPWLLRQPSLPVDPNVGFARSTFGVLMLALPALLLVVSGAWSLVCTAHDTTTWTRELVGRATGMALRRLLIFTSACAAIAWVPRMQARTEAGLAFSGWLVAGAILLGYPIALRLRRVFPPS